MSDQYTEAFEEMQEKSPFVCVSCGHPHDIAVVRRQVLGDIEEGVHDRFSEAVEELPEKSAFVCESCGNKQEISKKNLQ